MLLFSFINSHLRALKSEYRKSEGRTEQEKESVTPGMVHVLKRGTVRDRILTQAICAVKNVKRLMDCEIVVVVGRV